MQYVYYRLDNEKYIKSILPFDVKKKKVYFKKCQSSNSHFPVKLQNMDLY